jgi:glutamyl-tRNA reductase
MTRRTAQFAGPQLCVVGVNYSSTPVAIRERLSIPKAQTQEALETLKDYVPHGVILATCNRTEVYALDDRKGTAEISVRRFLTDRARITEEALEPYLYSSRNYVAARHLARAASGLYSMIVGEHEILGQVRQALEDADRARMANLPLRRLFQYAVRTGQRVREETGLSRNALSVSSVAVDLAAKVVGDVSSCKTLLIGAGEAGKLVAKALGDRGAGEITVASRSVVSADELASLLGGRAIGIDDMYAEMQASDIVITCTGAPHYVVQRQAVESLMPARGGRPLVIVDIAVPRDVEPEVKDIHGVYAYDIDNLDEVSEMNRRDREKEIDRAMQIVDDETETFIAWWEHLETKPVISALNQMANQIRERQLNASLKKLPNVTEEEREVLDAMTRAIVSRLLHQPIKSLRENGHRDGEFVQTVCQLFALDEQDLQ